MDGERGRAEVALQRLLPLNWALVFLDLLACFVVNEKKPDGNVPSKHFSDWLFRILLS